MTLTDTPATLHDETPKPARASRGRWAGAVLLTAGAFLAGTGLLTPPPANAVISVYDPADETHYCNFYDPFVEATIQGCFDASARITNTTNGGVQGDGKPVHPGDILQYTYTLTNNTTTTITDLSLYGTIPKHDCSPDPACTYDVRFDIKNDWYTNSGLDPYSLRIEGDPDVNTGHFQGTIYDHGLEIIGQAGHLRPGATADFRGYLPPGETTTTSFQIQVPYNAPTGSTYGMIVSYAHYDDLHPYRLSQALARYAQVDAPPTPSPTATATATATATITATPEPTPTATVTAEPTSTATPTTTSTPSLTSTATPAPTAPAVPTGTTAATPTTQAATPTPVAPAVSVPGSPTPPPGTPVQIADAVTSTGTVTDAGNTTQALASTGTPESTIWLITAGVLTAAAGFILFLAPRTRRARNH